MASSSPFPGMDPWLEQYWGDVHSRLVVYTCDQLQERLPPGLTARLEERVFVESTAELRNIFPDISVIEQRWEVAAAAPKASGPAVLEPVIVHVRSDPVTETFIEIRDARSGNRVITVVEVLSLGNKLAGEGQDEYLKKQREVRQSGASLVEIDLLRAGKRVSLVRPEQLPPELRTTYHVCVQRGWERHRAEVYPIKLRDRLPVLRIPLRQAEPDALVNLQEVFEDTYRKGRYGGDTDYTRDSRPPLEGEDAKWADQLLREKGRRK